jgi:hypothetical protein
VPSEIIEERYRERWGSDAFTFFLFLGRVFQLNCVLGDAFVYRPYFLG